MKGVSELFIHLYQLLKYKLRSARYQINQEPKVMI